SALRVRASGPADGLTLVPPRLHGIHHADTTGLRIALCEQGPLFERPRAREPSGPAIRGSVRALFGDESLGLQLQAVQFESGVALGVPARLDVVCGVESGARRLRADQEIGRASCRKECRWRWWGGD